MDGILPEQTKDSSAGSGAKGRYVESQLAKPEHFTGAGSMTLLSDGSLVIFDYQNGVKNSSSDGGQSWQRDMIPGISEIAANCEDVDGAIAPDGSIFFSYIMWNESTEDKLYPEKYVYLDADGKKQEFELGLEHYRTCLTKEVFSPDGRLFGLTDYKVYEIALHDHSAKLLFETEYAEQVSMYAGEKELVVQDGRVVYFYNYASGELTSEDGVLNAFI